MSSPDRGRQGWHGTWNGYANRGCRCHRCRKAGAAYQAARYRAATPTADTPPLYEKLAGPVAALTAIRLTRAAIATELKVSLRTVDRALHHLGLKPAFGPKIRHKRDKADAQIIALYCLGMPVEQVAARTGVVVSTVYRALHDHSVMLRRDSRRR